MSITDFVVLGPTIILIFIWIPVLVAFFIVFFKSAGRVRRILEVLEDIKNKLDKCKPVNE
jgi:hypothetical protein